MSPHKNGCSRQVSVAGKSLMLLQGGEAAERNDSISTFFGRVTTSTTELNSTSEHVRDKTLINRCQKFGQWNNFLQSWQVSCQFTPTSPNIARYSAVTVLWNNSPSVVRSPQSKTMSPNIVDIFRLETPFQALPDVGQSKTALPNATKYLPVTLPRTLNVVRYLPLWKRFATSSPLQRSSGRWCYHTYPSDVTATIL